MGIAKLHDTSTLSAAEVQAAWEDAYTNFETPKEEINKFISRLEKIGQSKWARDLQAVEIFCGRGNGLKALETLGFTNLEGVDISGQLLAQYDGPAKVYEADCRALPFEDESRDLIVVQGGLHHLQKIPEDLNQTLGEVARVLRPDGRFVLVEPWSTPFLQLIHFMSRRDLIRKASKKFDAFAAMVHYEAETYFNWLEKPSEILARLDHWFDQELSQIRLGKLTFIGRKYPTFALSAEKQDNNGSVAS